MRTKLLLRVLIGLVLIGSLTSFALSAGASSIKINFACEIPKGGTEEVAMEHFKKLVEERSNRELEVYLFMGGVLGKEKSVFEQLTLGETQMSVGGEIVVTTYAPELYIFGVPFIFPDAVTVAKILEGPLGQRINETVIKKANIMIVGYSMRAARQLITKYRKVVNPEDVVGMKLRLPSIASWIEAWKELGAVITPISASEIFTALQMGVIEAAENPLSPIYATRQHEVTKYLILTNHLYSFRAWSMSKRFFDSLNPRHQQIVLQAAKEASAYLTSIEEEYDKKFLEKMKAAGMEVIIPNREAFRKRMGPAVERIKKDWAPGLYEQYVKPYLP